MRLVALALCLLFLTACLPVETPSERAEEMKSAALLLEFEDGHCSGTAISKDMVLTASHCFEGGGELNTINGIPVKILKKVDDGNDHALIRVDIQLSHWRKVNPSLPKEGDRLRWVGNPAGLRSAYREGYVVLSLPDTTYIAALTFSGDSGAGMVNDKGEIAAVVMGATVWQNGMTMQLTVSKPFAFSDEELSGKF